MAHLFFCLRILSRILTGGLLPFTNATQFGTLVMFVFLPRGAQLNTDNTFLSEK